MKSTVIKGRNEPVALFRRDGSARTAGAVSKARGGYAIADTSTTAKKGDVYRAETATTALMVGKEYKIIDASTNSFTIASKDLPTLGDTFYILGKATPRVGSDGAAALSTTGLATEAKQDTQITSLAAIKTAVELLDNAVSGNELQVDIVTSALPSGASTSAHQITQNSLLTSVDGALADVLLAIGTSGAASNIYVIQVAGSDGTNSRFLKTNTSGELITEQKRATSSAVTTKAYSGTSAEALASTAGRLGAKFFNNTDGDCYIKFGTTASAADFTVKLSSGGYYNMEQPVYSGKVDIIFANGSAGNLLITELT